MIEAAERSRMSAALGMRCESMLVTRESSRSAVKSAVSMESTGVIEVLAIGENSAAGYVAVVVEHDPVVPIVSPVSPSPTEPAKEANSETKAPCETGPRKVQPGIPIPARPDPKGCSIDEPRIILGNVNDLRVRGLDHNGLPLLAHFFLQCAL